MGLITAITSVSVWVKDTCEVIDKCASEHKSLLQLVGLVTVHSNLNMIVKI